MIEGRKLQLVVVLALAACHRESNPAAVERPAPAASAPTLAKRGPTPDELTTGMVEAVTIGKSAVPVALKFDLPQRPVVGRPLEVVIAVMPQVAANSAVVQATASAGLQIAANAASIAMPALDPTQVYRFSIPVTPTGDGVQLLGLTVSLKQEDDTESRSFSIPIIVGAGPAENSQTVAPADKH